MLTGKKQAIETDLFRVPFSGTMYWKDYNNCYPDLSIQMDGKCKENCLLFYYELNPLSKIYEFKDYDAELDISEIIGIDLTLTVEGESNEEQEARKIKSCNNISELIEENKQVINKINSLNDMSKFNSKQNKEEIKKAKKERRLQRLIDRNNI